VRRARWIVLFVAGVLVASPARGAVRVDADEVIFTLRAPSAREVYLVGDFNQWNPTVEPMNRVGDGFEVGLFLVAGEYRYQFVVDGKWMNDPDHATAPGERGSPLVLVERGSALMLSTEAVGKGGPVSRARPGARYIGALRARDDSDASQRVDLTVRGRYDRLSARAAVATDDTSWAWSPPSMETWFDRGRVDVNLGKLAAQGFENDSTWISADPTGLVGCAGVFDYDAGFRRHGVAGTVSSRHVALRMLYADTFTRSPAVETPTAPVSSIPTGAPGDTTVATRYSFDGSDVLAFETALSFGKKGGAGVVYRRESGANPGVAGILRALGGGAYPAEVYATRENRAVTSVWVGRDDAFGARVQASYGWGSVESHAFGVTADTVLSGASIRAENALNEIDHTFPVMETERVLFEAGTPPTSSLHAAARWDFTRFEFDGLRGASRADVHRVTVSAEDTLSRWALGVRALYTNADYGHAPDALAIDWPELNPWLSIWDEYDAAGIVGIAFDDYSVVTASIAHAWDDLAARVEATAGLRDLASELVHATTRAHVDARLTGDFHAGADARAAWYDAAAWSSEGAVWSGYVEGRWCRGPFDVSVGFGFDPLVFDAVKSEYADIGYTKFLRDALANGVARSRGNEIVGALIQRERALEDAAVFKLELVVDLR
jgi:hypothetical protein